MKASLIQRQIKLNADVLSGLHEEYAKLRAERKKYNEEADKLALESLEHSEKEDFAMAGNTGHLAKDYREQAAIFTPYIKKFAKKIVGLQDVQKALKLEAKDAARIDAWAKSEDEEWQRLVGQFLPQQFDGVWNPGTDEVIWE